MIKPCDNSARQAKPQNELGFKRNAKEKKSLQKETQDELTLLAVCYETVSQDAKYDNNKITQKRVSGRSCKAKKEPAGRPLAQLQVGGEKEATHACSELVNLDLSLVPRQIQNPRWDEKDKC